MSAVAVLGHRDCQQIKTAANWRGTIKVNYCELRGLGTAKLPALEVRSFGNGDRIVIENSMYHVCGAVLIANDEESGTVFRKNTLLAISMVPIPNLPDQSRPGFRASESFIGPVGTEKDSANDWFGREK